MEQQMEGTARKLTEEAARGLEQMSARLRSRDLDGMVREAESFARSQPLAFFGAAVLAGFLGMRYLSSRNGGSHASKR